MVRSEPGDARRSGEPASGENIFNKQFAMKILLTSGGHTGEFLNRRPAGQTNHHLPSAPP